MWTLPPESPPIPKDFQRAIGGSPLVARILAQRGYHDPQAARAFMDWRAYTPAPPEALPDLPQAVARLQTAIRSGETIGVWGDFDVDGQTATTLLVQCLRELGANVRYYIPVRARESHGVHVDSLATFLNSGVNLLLTCDTGISAHAAVDYAATRGVETIITDHHDLSPTLPEAFAVINPKRLPAEHPLATLPGVGVAYKLAEALYAQADLPQAAEKLLDLVALGIVADVALQVRDTRYLLQRGLEVLRSTPRLGLQAIYEQAQLNPQYLHEDHIGFTLGPRLNALGRLEDANWIVEFLLTQDSALAQSGAERLERLNLKRKLLTDQVFQGALAQIERDRTLLDHTALVLNHPDWDSGVVGIVASRLVERFQRPVVLIAAPPDGIGRGSARSVAGVDISAAIAAQAELLEGFGGHPMAAGVAIRGENISRFRQRLSRAIESQRGGQPIETRQFVDAEIPLDALSIEFIRDIERLAPFGAGNPPPLFISRNVCLRLSRAVGAEKEHLIMVVEDAHGTTQKLMWWQGAGWDLPENRFDLVYRARTSTFRGELQTELEWVDFMPLAETQMQATALQVEILDYRPSNAPMGLLQNLLHEADVLVWAEAEARARVAGFDRTKIRACETLVIWTLPPAPEVLHAVLQQAQPQKVVLFAVEPETAQIEKFLIRLAGAVKYALRHKPTLPIETLAASVAQTEAAVLAGLHFLAARGDVTFVREGEMVHLKESGAASVKHSSHSLAYLQQVLDEAAAYRAYFRQAEVLSLLTPSAKRPESN